MGRVYVLTDYVSTYSGRGRAKVRSPSMIVLIKDDNSIVVHDMSGGVKAVNYNAGKGAKLKERKVKKILKISSLNDRGEMLRISGKILYSCETPKGSPSKNFIRLAGTEESIRDLIISNPSVLGLDEIQRYEEHTMSGRIDILTDEYVIEVKKRAGLKTILQIERYLKIFPKKKGMIVCLHASENLKKIIKKYRRLKLIELPQDFN